MKIMAIGSGSSGNCTYLEINGKRLLVDLGLNTKAISCALSKIDVSLSDIDAVIITHTHSDHVSALPVCKKKLCCSFFMSTLSDSKLCVENTVVIPCDRAVAVTEGIQITAFETSHDCPGSLGFRLDYNGGSFGYATDLGFVPDKIRNVLKGCDAVVLECNHDEQMLRDGPYPFLLKRRILSNEGHLSNDACAKTARFLAENGTKSIFLAHLSKENNTPGKAFRTVSSVLDGMDVHLGVLSPTCGELMEL